MYWQRDVRRVRGGYWVCPVKRRAWSRRTDNARRDTKVERQNAYYHSHGWLVARRRDLAKQRAHVLERLAQLEQEAEAC